MTSPSTFVNRQLPGQPSSSAHHVRACLLTAPDSKLEPLPGSLPGRKLRFTQTLLVLVRFEADQNGVASVEDGALDEHSVRGERIELLVV